MKTIQITCVFIFTLFTSSCQKSANGNQNKPPVVSDSSLIVKGADISWITQMEQAGNHFYNSAGAQVDCFQLMQSLGINAIRLRVWVNPSGGWNGNADVVAKALRAKQLGLRILIDFHYSDTWADPANQNKPAVWTAYDFPTLTSSVYNYTLSCWIR